MRVEEYKKSAEIMTKWARSALFRKRYQVPVLLSGACQYLKRISHRQEEKTYNDFMASVLSQESQMSPEGFKTYLGSVMQILATRLGLVRGAQPATPVSIVEHGFPVSSVEHESEILWDDGLY